MTRPDYMELKGIFYGNRAKSLVDHASQDPRIDLVESAAFGESYVAEVRDKKNRGRDRFVAVPKNGIYIHLRGPARIINGTDFWLRVDGLKEDKTT